MVRNIVKDMFDNTDETGTLIIKGWNVVPEECFSNPRFYKCRMNWDPEKMDNVANEAQELLYALEALAHFCAEEGHDQYTEPDLSSKTDPETAESLYNVWELFFGGFACEAEDTDSLDELAGERLGRDINAFNVFDRARRVFTGIRLGMPEMLLGGEKYEFVRALVLNRACEEMTCVDISEDRLDTKTVALGKFNKNDIERIFEILKNDCSVMPEEGIGYTLLVNTIFNDISIDIYRVSGVLKSSVDPMLETLSKAEQTVLELLYGLTDGLRRTYETAAFETHIPVSMIKGYEASALEKLRRPDSISKLKQLLCEHMNDIETIEPDTPNISAALTDLKASIDAGELTEEEQATFDLLVSNLPDEFKDLFE